MRLICLIQVTPFISEGNKVSNYTARPRSSHDALLIGCSSGGLKSTQNLLRHLHETGDFAVLISCHIRANSVTQHIQLLGKNCPEASLRQLQSLSGPCFTVSLIQLEILSIDTDHDPTENFTSRRS